MTNAPEVLQGGKPKYDEVGPYCYDYYRTKFNIEFSSDKNEVTYNIWQRFIFNAEQSQGHTEDEVIVNLNPNYMGVLATAGNEDLIAVAFSGPAIYNNIRWLTGPYINHKVAAALPSDLAVTVNATIGALQAANGNLTRSEATDLFYAVWANGTILEDNPTGVNFTGLLLSVENSNTASDISLATCQQLFDPSVPYSLTSDTKESTNTWYNATNVWNGWSPQAGRGTIQAAFNLTMQQVDVITRWYRNEFAPTFVYEGLIAAQQKKGAEQITDLGYLQWGECIDRKSVVNEYDDTPTSHEMEYGCFPKPIIAGSLDLASSKKLIVGKRGIAHMTNVPYFLAAFVYGSKTGNWSIVEDVWGLPADQAKQWEEYQAFVLFELVPPELGKIFAAGGGVITSKSVHRWIFNQSDPLLAIADPSMLPLSNLQQNETSEEESAEMFAASTMYTGNDDISKVAWYKTWMGRDEIPAPMYAKSQQIRGTNDWGQFEPLLNKKDIKNFTIFDTHYLRTLSAVRTGEKPKFRGITTYRYELSNDTWAVNPDLYTEITGFANISGLHNNTPIFASQPHFFGCDPKWGQKVEGVAENQNWETDITVIDVEPWTGQTLHVNKSLQVNVYIDADSKQFNRFFPNITKGLFYPLMWVRDEAELSKDNAKEFNDTVLLGIILKFSLWSGMLLLGIIFIIVAAILGVHVYMRHKKRNSTQLDIDSLSDEDALINARVSAYGSRSSVVSNGERY
eukprot:TRINITY_DN11737_c0_g1_i1.p1 TRINITY_DN11737_c0_g1~~TRINITY_DN11737_c0_g1_i1.p1  ORF type:complete len:836 (+),score=190.65 TRINITY_DN11737_c0_g1_i1:301-2508(+)